MSKLVNKTGLILRKHGRYVLSNYGKVVFHSLDIINRGSKHFWALKALDKDEFSDGDIPAEHVTEIGSRLIEDKDILRIVYETRKNNGQKKDILYEFTYNQGGTKE